MKKILFFIFSLILALLIIMVIKTAFYGSGEEALISIPESRPAPVNPDSVISRLSLAIQHQTISQAESPRVDSTVFAAFHDFLRASFPQLHAHLELTRINNHTLLFKWAGADNARLPVLLMAHQDVVPISPGSEAAWEHPPFSGVRHDEFIWGRGTLDDKGSLLAICESVEALLVGGHQPDRTIYLAFGHDEEVGGEEGAGAVAEYFLERDIRFELVLDEGGVIIDGIIPGVDIPVAMVGYTEKGGVTFKLTTEAPGGHSSMPPNVSAIGRLSAAIAKLQANPVPANMMYTEQFFERIAHKLPYMQQFVFANTWLLGPVLEAELSKVPAMNATLRTTTAPTIIESGNKANVLPKHARAVVNFRILPGETVEDVLAYVVETIDDSLVTVTQHGNARNPSEVSSLDSDAFLLLKSTIHNTMSPSEVLVAPYVVLGGTDSRYFQPLSNSVYRFLFNQYQPNDLARVHGTNERLAVKSYLSSIEFYYNFIVNLEHLN